MMYRIFASIYDADWFRFFRRFSFVRKVGDLIYDIHDVGFDAFYYSLVGDLDE